jgi:flagellar motility protein MotE (MotC chaperone)
MKRRVLAVVAMTLLLGAAGSMAAPTRSGTSDAATKPSRWDRADGLETLAAELHARQRAIERREVSVLAKAEDLAAAEARLKMRMTELEALRAEIDALLAGLDDAEEDRVVALVKMVEKMRAKDAAPIVSELDPELAVSVIDRMSSTKAGKMLAAMEPVTAAGLAARSAARPAVP